MAMTTKRNISSTSKIVMIGLASTYSILQFLLIAQWKGASDSETGDYSSFTSTLFSTSTANTLFDLPEEIRKSLDYVHSLQHIDRQLKFVHIPKAAGSAIEELAGKQSKLAWGSCLFNHRPKRRGNVCHYPPGQFEWPRKVGWWHIPSHLFPLLGTDPYENADLFVVTRNITERLLSEFYYVCRKHHNGMWNPVDCNPSRILEADYLNEWLLIQFQNMPSKSSTWRAADYIRNNGHLTPQYDFVVSPFQVRLVDYVLRMDRLADEFPRLMRAYGLNHIKWLPNKSNTARNHSTDLQADIITADVRAMIQERYPLDLELLI